MVRLGPDGRSEMKFLDWMLGDFRWYRRLAKGPWYHGTSLMLPVAPFWSRDKADFVGGPWSVVQEG